MKVPDGGSLKNKDQKGNEKNDKKSLEAMEESKLKE